MVRLALLLSLLAAPDFLARVGTTAQAAQEAVLTTVTTDSAWCPGDCRAVPYAARAEVARGAVAFARAYLRSDAFKAQYRAWWQGAQPQAPETVEVQEAREAEGLEQQAAEAEQARLDLTALAAKEKNPELKRAYAEALAAQARMRKELDSPQFKDGLASTRTLMAQSRRAEYAEALARYQSELAQWKALEDPSATLRTRLDAFLALSATVDFKAKTALREGRVVFVDEAFEDKPARWKLLFRAGPEVVGVLRSAAQAWRAEL